MTFWINFVSFIRTFNDEANFPDKLWLTDTKFSRICKDFANGSLAYMKFSKTQLSKMIKLRVFFIYMIHLMYLVHFHYLKS